MRFNITSPFSNQYPSSSPQNWDPEDVLGLANQNYSIRGVTCMGWATTRNRRCQRVPAQHKIMSARSILNRLAHKCPSKAAGSPELREAAELLLCWQHQNQTDNLLRQWRMQLEDWAADQDDDNSPSSASAKSDPRARTTEGQSRVKKEATDDLSAEELRKMMKEIQENLARLKAEFRRREGKDTKRDEGAERAAPRRSTKREEEAQQSREEERRRREEEQRRKQEEEKRQKEEQKREEEARKKAHQERVRLEKERREREARRKLEKEAEEWRAAWKRYSNAWDEGASVSIANMPWPVKSGLQSDVNEANVKLFFAKAPPKESVDSGEKRYKLISAETKRWHTDKTMPKCSPDTVDGASKAALEIIARVIIKLRQEAKRDARREGMA
ncbi:hypothetical protein F5Y13DRAFT_59617 [Hypoxylon sp. FL1857]|nr:hypothetical protein F5Y13DRAFT_59617 [Hypoxylon sp. FL1857]